MENNPEAKGNIDGLHTRIQTCDIFFFCIILVSSQMYRRDSNNRRLYNNEVWYLS